MAINFYVWLDLEKLDWRRCVCNGAWLLQISFIGLLLQNLHYWSSCFNYVSSQVARAIAWNSAFALDLATALCFLPFHEMRLPPIRSQYLKVDFLSLGKLAQSSSTYPTIAACPLLFSYLWINPFPREPLIYLCQTSITAF